MCSRPTKTSLSDIDIRARSATEIVDAAFSLYRQNIGDYVLVTAILSLPGILLTLMLQGGKPVGTPGDMYRMLPVYAVSIVFGAIAKAIVMVIGSDVYLNRPEDLSRSIREVVPRIPAIVFALVLTFIAYVIGLILLIFPALYVAARLFAVAPAVVLERNGAFEALGRSGELADGHKWRILGVLLLTYGIFLTLNLGVSMLATSSGNQIAILLVGAVFGIAAAPIVNLAVMVLYYDMRIRKEGFDVEYLTSTLAHENRPIAGSSIA